MQRRRFFETSAFRAAGAAVTLNALGGTGTANAAPGIVREPSRDIPVIDETDILVLGAGPAGCAAAISAGRLGANVLLVERYGYFGGMGTGGLVILIDNYDFAMKGLPAEFVQRILDSDGRMVETNRVIKHMPFTNPETVKFIYLDMAGEAGVRFLLHSWAVDTVVRDGMIDAVIVESKSGRSAIRAKRVIDCTGDADTAAWTGVPFESSIEPNGLALDMIYSNVDFDAYRRFMVYHPDEWNAVMGNARDEGFGWQPWYIGLGDQAWFNNMFKGSPIDVYDLTACEIDFRHRIMKHHQFFRENVPGFETATIQATAPQLGTRLSRRIKGGHLITMDDLTRGTFEDTIGKTSGYKTGFLSDIPYRALVPEKIDNVLYAGRCISGSVDVMNILRSIPGCWVFGQAAGTATVLSLKDNVPPRDVNVRKLQDSLRSQGVAI